MVRGGPRDRHGDLCLGGKSLKPGLPVGGFVFFSRGAHTRCVVIAAEDPGGAVVEIHALMVPKPPP